MVRALIIGAQKSATTTLAHLLGLHPDIEMCQNKEPHFFSKYYDKGIDYYHSLFSSEKDGVISMEASTSYTFFPAYRNVAERIFDYNPEMKLIYILRNPSERILSNYKHRYIKRATKKEFLPEILSNPQYFFTTDYALQIHQYLALFPKSNIHFVIMEEFLENPGEELKKVMSFLKIANTENGFTKVPKLNAAEEKNKLPATLLNFLESKSGKLLPYRIKRGIKNHYLRNLPEFKAVSIEEMELVKKLVFSSVLGIEKLIGREIGSWNG